MAGFALYKFIPRKVTKPVIIEIEQLPEDHKGFGYIRGNSVVLNEHGTPYLYKTYAEAKRRMKRVRDVDRIIFQQWDLDSQTVLMAEVKHGQHKRQESKSKAK
jgi:hypothetical protein